ncbi:MAG: hypothetical protein [Wenzhou bat rhabdovirus 3]|nr:MAG: hypothetical protein [Wenzhou bat rhabdovirus 3]
MQPVVGAQDTVASSTTSSYGEDKHPYITALYQVFSDKYNIWLGMLTLLVIMLWCVVFYMLCPCFKTVKRWIMSHADDINERLEAKIRKREEKKMRSNRNRGDSEYLLLDRPETMSQRYP